MFQYGPDEKLVRVGNKIRICLKRLEAVLAKGSDITTTIQYQYKNVPTHVSKDVFAQVFILRKALQALRHHVARNGDGATRLNLVRDVEEKLIQQAAHHRM